MTSAAGECEQTQEAQGQHTPVLLKEVVDGLKIRPDGIYVDGTTGGGGHSEAIALRLGTGRLICIDKDESALVFARKKLSAHVNKIDFVHDGFENLSGILDNLGFKQVDGVLFDLGISSMQLDDPTRGFSLTQDGPLDMRLDRSAQMSAADIVATYDHRRLESVLRLNGEERYARRISTAIVRARALEPITSTLQLAKIVTSAIPASSRTDAQHPAIRSFMALRIETNGELALLHDSLLQSVSCLKPSGRICVISFHSLEDRIVKQTFAQLARGCQCSKDLPVCICGKEPTLRIIKRKPTTPGTQEIEHNPRSRSGKLRVAERLSV